MEVDMKSKKWIWVTLTILLTLIVLAGVAGAGFRMGVMQSANLARNADGTTSQFPPFGYMHGFEGNFNNQRGDNPLMMQGFGHDGPGHGGFERGRGGFFSPLFGLVHLIVLGALIWLGYKFVKNSGWRLTRVAQPAPGTSEASIEEKKE